MPDVWVSTFYGGTSVVKDSETLGLTDKGKCPHIVVATPGCLIALVRGKLLDAKKVKHFVVDECDKCWNSLTCNATFKNFSDRRHTTSMS